MSNTKKVKGFHQFMSHKDFHPSNWQNIKAVFEAREKKKIEEKLAAERDEEYRKEQDDLNDQALMGDEKAKNKIAFMYKPPPGVKVKEKSWRDTKFEWQRKWNAPREEWVKNTDSPWVVNVQDKPFGIAVRHVYCKKCKDWGHLAVDQECPLYDKYSKDSEESSRPSDLMKKARQKREGPETVEEEVEDDQKPCTSSALDDALKKAFLAKVEEKMKENAANDLKRRFDGELEDIPEKPEDGELDEQETEAPVDPEKIELASYLLTTAKDFDSNPHELAAQMQTDYKMKIKGHIIDAINIDRNIVNFKSKPLEDEQKPTKLPNGINADVIQNYLSSMTPKEQKILFKRFFEEAAKKDDQTDDKKDIKMIIKEPSKKRKKNGKRKASPSPPPVKAKKSKNKKEKKLKKRKRKHEDVKEEAASSDDEIAEPVGKHRRTVVLAPEPSDSSSSSSSLTPSSESEDSDKSTSEDEAALMRQVLLKRRLAAIQEKRKNMKMDLKKIKQTD